jgi:anhydro-N-acetylmuramic acid kinase
MRVLGLSSGTSHDAVDAAVVDLDLDDGVLSGELVHFEQIAYPDELRVRLAAALPPAMTTMREVCRLDTGIGQAFAQVAATMVEAAGPVDLICSHGQTVYHWVAEGQALGTLQLGQPAWIAECLGVPVVSDLRAADLAAGGQGAPLVSLLDMLLLRGLPEPAGALNLGGIANLTVVSDPPVAYDVGPGNALMDAAVLSRTGKPCDLGGRLASAGIVHPGLLALLMDEPYYELPAPKTTGKELFHSGYLDSALEVFPDVATEDLLATLATLTAVVVAGAVKAHGLETVVVSGGGVENPALMRRLTRRLPGVKLERSEAFGVPSAAKEAIAFAVLGWHTAHGLPGTLPPCTGAVGARVLGRMTSGRGGELPGAPTGLAGRVSGAPPVHPVAVRFGVRR